MTLCVEALEGDLRGRITELAWAPTRWMLADAMTKNPQDVLLGKLMATGSWRPDEWELYSQGGECYCAVGARCNHYNCACLTTEEQELRCWWHLPLIPEEERASAVPQAYWFRHKPMCGLSGPAPSWIVGWVGAASTVRCVGHRRPGQDAAGIGLKLPSILCNLYSSL